MMSLPDVIAIDGPAASGKSTIAQILAKDLGYLFFDTGVMYRAVTWAALHDHISTADERAVSELARKVVIDVLPPSRADGRMYDVLLDGEDITWQIRSRDVEAHVSIVSAYAEVRQALTAQQRRIGQRGRVVMVGRDIGTVVLPEAPLKIYLDASIEERSRRRFEELRARGEVPCFEHILAGLIRRDEIDSTRAVAPLRPANDAVIIDTDGLTIEQVTARIQALLDATK